MRNLKKWWNKFSKEIKKTPEYKKISKQHDREIKEYLQKKKKRTKDEEAYLKKLKGD